MKRCSHYVMLVLALAAVVATGATVWAADEKPAAQPGKAAATVQAWSYQAWPSAPPGYYLLQMEHVRKQIGLTAEQNQKLQEITKKFYEKTKAPDWSKVKDMKPEEQKTFYKDVQDRYTKASEMAKKQAEEVLQPKQIKQLQEMELRQRASIYLYSSQVIEQLGLSDEQKENLRKVREATQNKMMELQQKSMARTLDVLTKEQRKKLKEIVKKGAQGWKAIAAPGVNVTVTEKTDKPAATKAQPKPGTPAAEAPSARGSMAYSYYPVPGYYLLSSEPVQKEIGLTAEQKEKLKEITKKYQDRVTEQWKEYQTTDWNKVREMKPEEQKKFYEELRQRQVKQAEVTKKLGEEAKQQVDQVLLPKQVEQLKEIEFRQRAVSMLYQAQVLDQAGLSGEQKEKIAKIRQEMQSKTAEVQAKISQLQNEANKKMLDVLTAEQLKKLKEMSEKGYPGGQQGGQAAPKPQKQEKK